MGFGQVYHSNGNVWDLDIGGIVNVRLFLNMMADHPINGAKALDQRDFQKIIQLMEKKAHLTTQGMNKIIKLVYGMNSRRTVFK